MSRVGVLGGITDGRMEGWKDGRKEGMVMACGVWRVATRGRLVAAVGNTRV